MNYNIQRRDTVPGVLMEVRRDPAAEDTTLILLPPDARLTEGNVLRGTVVHGIVETEVHVPLADDLANVLRGALEEQS